jgi:hypothetical protein
MVAGFEANPATDIDNRAPEAVGGGNARTRGFGGRDHRPLEECGERSRLNEELGKCFTSPLRSPHVVQGNGREHTHCRTSAWQPDAYADWDLR